MSTESQKRLLEDMSNIQSHANYKEFRQDVIRICTAILIAEGFEVSQTTTVKHSLDMAQKTKQGENVT